MNMREQKYEENKANAWALVNNQCSHKLRVKLEGTSGYNTCKNDNDVILLLTIIKGYCCQFDALNDFFQKHLQSSSDYHEDFLTLVEIIEKCGGVGSLTFT